jgi:hypothetical protein
MACAFVRVASIPAVPLTPIRGKFERSGMSVGSSPAHGGYMTHRIAAGFTFLRVAAALLAVTAMLAVGAAKAEPAFKMTSLALYQPNDVLVTRLGNDPAPFADYIKQIVAREAAVLANAGQHPGASGAIVVAIKPGQQSKVWIVMGLNGLPEPLLAQMKAEAESVAPVSVRLGPIAFAINFDVWGGGQSVTDATNPVPVPPEWLGGSGREVLPDGPLSRIWP